MLKESLSDYKNPDNKIKRMSDGGEIVRLTKNLYETNVNTPGHLAADTIYSPSYLSFDYALSYYGLIPEMVYTYTSATFNKKKKKQYINKLGTFTYRDVPSKVYPYGINIKEEGDYTYLLACPEKAICDKLYTIKSVKNKKEMYNLLFDDLRIDEDKFKELNFDDLNILCDLYGCTNLKLLKKVVGDFMKHKGNEKPSEELLESLKEVEDYKNGDIELDTYEDVKEMRISLLDY